MLVAAPLAERIVDVVVEHAADVIATKPEPPPIAVSSPPPSESPADCQQMGGY